MRLEELEEMMSEEPDEAEAALSELVTTANVQQLSHIARSGRVHDLKLRAIDGLGEVGGPEATDTLTEMLEAASTAVVVGGTEQRMERSAVQERLMQSLARARGGTTPPVRSQRST